MIWYKQALRKHVSWAIIEMVESSWGETKIVCFLVI
jgi:hypothetical protein